MLRPFFVISALLATPLALSVPERAESAWQDREDCDAERPAAKRRRSILGGVIGGLADSALGRAGVPGSVAGIGIPVGSLLSDAIIDLLDCREQRQAADATTEAVRGGVGTTATWESESRAGVSGSSSVTAEERLADGSHCMTVTDVVIVDGEETTAPKTMCRQPGASGYVRV